MGLQADDTAGARCVFFSQSSRGGAGWFLFLLVQSIAEAGAKVVLIAPEADPASRETTHPNVERVKLKQGFFGTGSRIRRGLFALRRIMETFVALFEARSFSRNYFINMPSWLSVLILQLLWLRLLGGKIHYIVHDVTPHASKFPRQLRWIERWMLKASYRLPAHIVTLTKAARNELLANFAIAPEKVTVIEHGAYELEKTSPMPGNNIVLAFGWLRRNKHVLETIEGFGRLPENSPLRLVIAGAPSVEEPAYWRQCEAALKGLGDRVRTEIGFVPDERVKTLIEESDALILPYDDFNSQSGVAVLGAFSQRLLLVTDAGGIGELLEAGLEAIQIERPVTPGSVQHALEALAAMPLDERRLRATRSRDGLAERLSWSRIGAEYVKLMRRKRGPADAQP